MKTNLEELDKLLEEERDLYIRTETAFYALSSIVAPQFRDLRPTLEESCIQEHLDACRDFYKKYGTKFREGSPWMEYVFTKYPNKP